MNANRELLRDRLDGFGKSLFDAADVDAPKSGSADKLLVALGIGAAVTAVATPAAAAPAAAAAKGTTVATMTKLAVVLALASGGAVAVHEAAKHREAPVVVATLATTSPPPAIATTAKAKATASESITPVALPDAPPEPAKSTASAPRAPALSEQVALLDDARSQLASGDATSALATTRRFEQRFGRNATLYPEAMLVAVQANLARGDRDAARSIAQSLEKTHPHTPATSKVRELVN